MLLKAKCDIERGNTLHVLGIENRERAQAHARSLPVARSGDGHKVDDGVYLARPT